MAERQTHMDTESAELARMQEDLDNATARAEADLRHREEQVSLAQRELEAAGALHSSLARALETQRQNAEIDSAAAAELRKFQQDADVVLQASSVLEQQRGECEAKVEEIRSSLEVVDTRVPSLEGEKKRAVSSRNFKAAKNIVAEIKALTESKAGLEAQLEEARGEMNALSETIASKEEEGGKTKEVLAQKLRDAREAQLGRARVVRKMLGRCQR